MLLINKAMWRDLTAFQISILLALQHRGLDIFGFNEKANGTMIFNVSVLLEVFNEFNEREIKQRNVFAGMLWNKMFPGNIAVLRCEKVCQRLAARKVLNTALSHIFWSSTEGSQHVGHNGVHGGRGGEGEHAMEWKRRVLGARFQIRSEYKIARVWVLGFAQQERKRRGARTSWVLVAGEGHEDGEAGR